MPIQTSPFSSLKPWQFSNALRTITRQGFKLTNPTGKEDQLYTNSVPTASDLDEGSAMFYVSGVTYRLYFKIGGVVKYIGLS